MVLSMGCIFSCYLLIQRIRKWDSNYGDSPTLLVHIWTLTICAINCKVNWLLLNLPNNSNLIKDPTVILEVKSKPGSDFACSPLGNTTLRLISLYLKINHIMHIIKLFLKRYSNIKKLITLGEKKIS